MTCEKMIVRGVLLRAMRGLTASQPMAKALLDFGRKHGLCLFGLSASEAGKLTWASLKKELWAIKEGDDPAPEVLVLGHELAQLLGLDQVDSDILTTFLAFERLPLASELAELLSDQGAHLPIVIGENAGLDRCEAERRVRQHILIQLGLISFKANIGGKVELNTSWSFERLLDRQPSTREGLLELLVGPAQAASLSIDDFAHVSAADFLRRLLAGAKREKAKGINILIHGPPGTGKTEFARALTKAAGCHLHAIGEALDDGEEPSRYDRICAYQMGQRLLAQSESAVLLFDEMEDFVGDAQPTGGDWMRGREGSKVFVNRLLETNPVPVIWTTNAVGNIDPATLRRMSYVLELDLPSRRTAMRILGRVAEDEGVSPGQEWTDLIERAPEAASVLRVAAQAGRLAGESDGGTVPARSLIQALRGEKMSPTCSRRVDLSLYESDLPIAPLIDAVREGEHLDVSLLLTGPPGTGKTALAHHFARQLDLPLMVKRSSDLLSKWVGETEGNIAQAFDEARHRESVLLLDEVDSLLFDRSSAKANWEVSQVNELLTWLDNHPLPVIAATNFASKLDPATARRFVFKLELRPLSAQKSAAAFEQFFGAKAPAELARLTGLTPGDFALVARQMRHAPCSDPGEIVARLADELTAKPSVRTAIGF